MWLVLKCWLTHNADSSVYSCGQRWNTLCLNSFLICTYGERRKQLPHQKRCSKSLTVALSISKHSCCLHPLYRTLFLYTLSRSKFPVNYCSWSNLLPVLWCSEMQTIVTRPSQQSCRSHWKEAFSSVTVPAPLENAIICVQFWSNIIKTASLSWDRLQQIGIINGWIDDSGCLVNTIKTAVDSVDIHSSVSPSLDRTRYQSRFYITLKKCEKIMHVL